MSRAPLAIALLAVSAAAPAAKDPWIRVTSPHFEVSTDAGERAGRDVAAHFERVHAFFLQRFKTGIDPARKACVILFRNEKEYQQYRPNSSASAFYHPGEYRDFIVLDHSIGDWRPTAVHELTHLMLHQLGQPLPLWLDEGLADLYSNMEPRGARIMVGRDIPGRMRVLSGEPWIPLRALLAVNHESPLYTDQSLSGLFYAESWKLVHMLHLAPAYESHLGDLVRALARADAPAAFQAAYGKDLDAVERDLRAYLGGDTIAALLFDIQLPKSVDAPQVAADASLPARLALAELLSNMRGRTAEAAQAFAAAERDFPGRYEVEEAMGFFDWHERRLDEAARHFARARELGCANGATFLLWGRVLAYANRPAEAAPVLARAVELLPDSAEAQLAYGDALIRNGEWSAAVEALRAVKSVPAAAQWRYSYNLAYGLYRLGETEAAKPLLARARKSAANPRENASLDQLEAALNRPPRAATLWVEGTLESMECGQLARLHVRTGDTVKIFLAPDSRTMQAMDLDCGPQPHPPRLRIEYQPLPADPAVTGVVRTLELR